MAALLQLILTILPMLLKLLDLFKKEGNRTAADVKNFHAGMGKLYDALEKAETKAFSDGKITRAEQRQLDRIRSQVDAIHTKAAKLGL